MVLGAIYIVPGRRVTLLPELPWGSQLFLHFLTKLHKPFTWETKSWLSLKRDPPCYFCTCVRAESRGHVFKTRYSPEFFRLLYVIAKIAFISAWISYPYNFIYHFIIFRRCCYLCTFPSPVSSVRARDMRSHISALSPGSSMTVKWQERETGSWYKFCCGKVSFAEAGVRHRNN